MKADFYPKLAWSGIKKNKKLYLPYILTCAGMVSMYFIILSMTESPVIAAMPGGDQTRTIMEFGTWVVLLFAVIFLFYTNSFLIRRRNKELGLYNILGMSKRNIVMIMFFETLIIAGFSLAGGLLGGCLLSKLAELWLMRLMKTDFDFTFRFVPAAFGRTVLIFAGIFLLLFLNSVRRVFKLSSIELLHSESTGEKPPKANRVLGIAGVILLAAAYWLAENLTDPMTVILMFFVAAMMVIAATYLLFISGSVLLCRILQKKKDYYYKSNHFVSVSSMAFRMNRSGAGLASICILLTMVIIIIASTACLYLGSDDSLHSLYPNDINIDVALVSSGDIAEENISTLRGLIDSTASACGADISDTDEYTYSSLMGYMKDGIFEPDGVYGKGSGYIGVIFMPLDDYDRVSGESHQLADDEALMYFTNCTVDSDTIELTGGRTLKITERLDKCFLEKDLRSQTIGAVLLVVSDFDGVTAPFTSLSDVNGDRAMYPTWHYGFDTSAPEEQQGEICSAVKAALSGATDRGIYTCYVDSFVEHRADYYSSFGSLFFLGIILSMVFMFATVLIIYYKQISEGYEDQSRFEVMQKVGMTKQDIRRSINSQMLTVFMLPVVFAVLHFVFAFPMIKIILACFNLTNIRFFVVTSAVSIALFTLLYVLVYRITARAYYNIVSGAKEE